MQTTTRDQDVIIVGGGVIGLTLAYELAGQGVEVLVLEQGDFGREASWAGAGILPPGNPGVATDGYAKLRAASHLRWPVLSADLREQTGVDNGYRRCGGITLRLTQRESPLDNVIAEWRQEGIEVEPLPAERLFELEPELNRSIADGLRLPQLAQVRNPRHLRALIAGCAARRVRLVSGSPVVGFDRQNDRIIAVRTPDRPYSAEQFCICSGAWSRHVLAAAGGDVPVEPIRGQIVLLSMQPLPFRHVIEHGPRYLVPRPDGRILIGSTEERAGFDKQNTASAVAELIDFGCQLVPKLARARFERAWAGLRPGSPDGRPYLGRVPGTENLFVAAGHFRAGLQLSPGTALVMRQLLLGEEPAVALDEFAVDRHLCGSLC